MSQPARPGAPRFVLTALFSIRSKSHIIKTCPGAAPSLSNSSVTAGRITSQAAQSYLSAA